MFCQSRYGSKQFDTLMVFLKEFFRKVEIETISRRQKSTQNYPGGKEPRHQLSLISRRCLHEERVGLQLGQKFLISCFTNPPTVIFRKVEKIKFNF